MGFNSALREIEIDEMGAYRAVKPGLVRRSVQRPGAFQGLRSRSLAQRITRFAYLDKLRGTPDS